MTDNELLEEIKNRMLITGNYHDQALLAYIQDTKNYMRLAGVTNETLETDEAIGAIYRGVSDLFNNQNSFSRIFIDQVIPLSATYEA